ncbi:MAG: tetratricopeptide repeat protein [Deltaproteobacteria bacterium]|nr:tetratricopeptide repeat protein [Deltaproteobacteria bacterium]
MVRNIVVFTVLLLLPWVAAAQSVPVITTAGEQPTNNSGGSTATPPQIVNTPMTFAQKLAQGHQLYLDKNFTGALSTYEQAKEIEPGNAAVYYFIGCAQVKLGRHVDARVTLKTVATLAGSKDESLAAKAMFLTAVIEEDRKRFDTAKEDWTSYKGYAQTHQGAVTFVSSADARLAAYEKKRELDEKYAVVRERIASSN